jgi:hypothetical protein
MKMFEKTKSPRLYGVLAAQTTGFVAVTLLSGLATGAAGLGAGLAGGAVGFGVGKGGKALGNKLGTSNKIFHIFVVSCSTHFNSLSISFKC